MAEVGTQIAAALQQLIAARLDLMIDEGTCVRPGDLGQTPTLDDDGNVVAPEGPVVYGPNGRCAVADPSSALIGNRTVNDDDAVPNKRILRVPHTADLHPGDVFTVTASAVSPGLVGKVFVVVGEEERTYATYRRYVLRGSSWLGT